MIAALQRLKSAADDQPLPAQMAAFGIKGGRAAASPASS